jgi:proteasome lid subunit RPN8/RPN11
MFEREVIVHAESNPEEEVCGFILLHKDLTVSVEPAINEHSAPRDCFTISPKSFIKHSIDKTIVGIYHSHPRSNEKPSPPDIAMSEEMGIPYLIYSVITKKFFLYYPESYEPEKLTGKPYIKGFFECTCMFKDYFKKELNINISKWNENYWLPQEDKDANKLLINILNNNLEKIEDKKLQKHDVILFQVKKNFRYHVGIYCGDDYFLHQATGILSRRELLDERWQAKIKEVYRHPSLV